MAVVWYIEPVGANANEWIAKWLEEGVTEAEKHGVPTSEGKKNLYVVTHEQVLQAIVGGKWMFRVWRAANEDAQPRPANVETLIKRAAKKGYFMPTMREEYAGSAPER
jgi:hypothetical protein